MNRLAKLRQWSEELMQGALMAVRDGTLGVNRAILEFCVSRLCIFWLSLIKYIIKLDKNERIASSGLTTPSVTDKSSRLSNFGKRHTKHPHYFKRQSKW